MVCPTCRPRPGRRVVFDAIVHNTYRQHTDSTDRQYSYAHTSSEPEHTLRCLTLPFAGVDRGAQHRIESHKSFYAQLSQ